MGMPQDLSQYLTEIRDYLQSQENKLIKKSNKQGRNEQFLELTKAINCVKSLESIQSKIIDYWEQLEK